MVDASEKKARTPTELLCAVAVAAIAFWAPAEDTGFILRTIGAAMALGGLLFAMIGLEMILDYQKKQAVPKANPFEVVTRKLDVPTAPPGGVFGAACNMSTLLQVRFLTLRISVWPAAAAAAAAALSPLSSAA